MSTDYVFDGAATVSYSEENIPNLINAYEMSKRLGEMASLVSGDDALVVRTARLYSHCGKNFVKSIMHVARREPGLRGISDQRGRPTFVEDVASTLIALMAEKVRGAIHLTNRGDCTWYEFAVVIMREMGLTRSVDPISAEEAGCVAKRSQFSVLNQDRLASLEVQIPEWRRSLA